MALLRDLIETHNDRVSALMASFKSQIDEAVSSATVETLRRLQPQLNLVDDEIQGDASDYDAMVGVSESFDSALRKAGYFSLITAFVSAIADQVDDFRLIHDELAPRLGLTPLTIGPESRSVLLAYQESAIIAMHAASFSAKASIDRLAPQTSSAPSFSKLSVILQYAMRGADDVVHDAELAAMSFFRLLGDLTYQGIEDLRYRYVGPRDSRNRPFCRHILDLGRTYTRAEIDEMENGQISDVFVNCGGYACRHWWLPVEHGEARREEA